MKRWEIINKLIKAYDLESYLEIGVHQKECFNKIECKLRHCVDPNFPATFEMTSDGFFNMKSRKLRNLVDGDRYEGLLKYSLIYIDGLHTEHQAYSDIKHAIERVEGKGFIIVHDCNPKTKFHTRPPEQYKRGEEWNGTTYRAFIRFKNEHPELTCFTVDADSGCGIITDRPMLENKIFDNDWDYFDKHRRELLQLTSVEEFKKLI